MLRYNTKTRPGLVALYDIRPGNGAGQFLQPQSPHGATEHGVECVKQSKDQEDCCKSNKTKLKSVKKNYIWKLGGSSELPRPPLATGLYLDYCKSDLHYEDFHV